MNIKFELLPPTMPNFATIKQKFGLKQDGSKVDNKISIADFTRQEAEEYAQLMYKTFLEHWEQKQTQK